MPGGRGTAIEEGGTDLLFSRRDDDDEADADGVVAPFPPAEWP